MSRWVGGPGGGSLFLGRGLIFTHTLLQTDTMADMLCVLPVCLFAHSKPNHTQMMTFDATCIV